MVPRTGEPDRPPSKVGVAVTDISTGLYAHGAIMAALISRQKTGKGVWIDCNLFESQVHLLLTKRCNHTLIFETRSPALRTLHPTTSSPGRKPRDTARPIRRSFLTKYSRAMMDTFCLVPETTSRYGQLAFLPKPTHSANSSQFKLFADKILGQPELGNDTRFSTNGARVANRELLVKIITDTLMRESLSHWLRLFDGLG